MNIPIYYDCKSCEGKFPSRDYDHESELCKDCLTTDKEPVAKLHCSDGVMPNGHYWINDKHRYGWEVVRILGGNLYRFGVSEACNLDKNKFEFTKIEEPEKA